MQHAYSMKNRILKGFKKLPKTGEIEYHCLFLNK